MPLVGRGGIGAKAVENKGEKGVKEAFVRSG